MFQSQVVDYIERAVKNGTSEANKKDLPSRDEIKSRVTVALDMLHATGANAAAGSLTCAGNIAVQFRRRGDEKVMRVNASSPEFNIYKGEHGSVYSVPAPLALIPLMDKLGKDGE
ncbi:hypothetical protein ACI1PM_03180 [Ralstonia nicotianae]|uniref:hypothetical protein n=1 Tax=Ralstonia nicotianae TaxID=3037696 RepID=UPI0039A2C62D